MFAGRPGRDHDAVDRTVSDRCTPSLILFEAFLCRSPLKKPPGSVCQFE
jgi:hypothetical protein